MRAALVVVAVLGLAACAQSTYDASKLQSELRRAGVPPEAARCVTDGLENTFDINQLGSHTEPTAQEIDTTRRLLARCGVKPPPR